MSAVVQIVPSEGSAAARRWTAARTNMSAGLILIFEGGAR